VSQSENNSSRTQSTVRLLTLNSKTGDQALTPEVLVQGNAFESSAFPEGVIASHACVDDAVKSAVVGVGGALLQEVTEGEGVEGEIAAVSEGGTLTRGVSVCSGKTIQEETVEQVDVLNVCSLLSFYQNMSLHS